MIELKDVTKLYGEKRAVDRLSLSMREGEITVIIGPSGCGKTTTLRMINRLIPPTEGSVFVDGADVGSVNTEELRRGMGYVIQSVGLFPHMTVAANIATVPRLLGWRKEDQQKRVDELLSLIGLDPEEYRKKFPSQLSGGEAQRIGVARALAANPPVLLMDEPFGAVDPLNREILQAEFLKIQKKLRKTVVFVTHDLDEAIRMADRILVMKDGKVVQFDTPEEILSHPADNFVRDFVGTNRALKRLSRFSVDDSYHKSEPLCSEDTFCPESVAKLDAEKFLWVTDSQGILRGWVQKEEKAEGKLVGDLMTPVNYTEMGILPESTLREALSRMLSEEVMNLPVVTKEGLFLGEISIEEIHSR